MRVGVIVVVAFRVCFEIDGVWWMRSEIFNTGVSWNFLGSHRSMTAKPERREIPIACEE